VKGNEREGGIFTSSWSGHHPGKRKKININEKEIGGGNPSSFERPDDVELKPTVLGTGD